METAPCTKLKRPARSGGSAASGGASVWAMEEKESSAHAAASTIAIRKGFFMLCRPHLPRLEGETRRCEERITSGRTDDADVIHRTVANWLRFGGAEARSACLRRRTPRTSSVSPCSGG